MNINATTPYSQNFQARIRMDKPNLKVLAQTAIGTSASAAGAATIAEGAFSLNAIGDNAYSIESIPREVVDSHRGFLTSAGHRYDAAGETGGIPVQSTVVPLGSSASGVLPIVRASNAYKNAFGEDNLKATTVMPLDASIAVSANRSAQKSMLGTGYLGTAAASLYSGNVNIENLNVRSAELSDAFVNGDGNNDDVSAVIGFYSLSVPVVLGSGKLASMASDTKSSQFVADTLSDEKTDGKTDKKLPS